VASDPARYGVDTIQLRQLTRMLQAIEGELLDGRIYLVRWHSDTAAIRLEDVTHLLPFNLPLLCGGAELHRAKVRRRRRRRGDAQPAARR